MKSIFAVLACGAFVAVSALGNEGNASASDLLALAAKASPLTSKYYISDVDSPKTIEIDSIKTARIWTADMDIDCDGQSDPRCADDQSHSGSLSCGTAINPAETPFFVMPASNTTWAYAKDSIKIGQIAAIIYNNQVEYAVFLDACGIDGVIGEASYAAAYNLGVDPDPDTGGTDGPVTYIIFRGASGRLASADWSNHDKAISVGSQLAVQLLASAGVTSVLNKSSELKGNASAVFAGGKLNIAAEGNWSAELLDMKGRNLRSFNGTGARSIELRDLVAGVYCCLLRSGTSSILSRISLTN